ncbi:hypothetical protein ebA3281 [Aromatoleum aromaticum EbN1]|nr:hypothetical protein ebA3281 [Aromatoleum aromaticum EbN1]
MRMGSILVQGGLRVSIHAPRHRGAMLRRGMATKARTGFQSTPPVTEGRCAALLPIVFVTFWFQSTPPVTEGRCSSHVMY